MFGILSYTQKPWFLNIKENHEDHAYLKIPRHKHKIHICQLNPTVEANWPANSTIKACYLIATQVKTY